MNKFELWNVLCEYEYEIWFLNMTKAIHYGRQVLCENKWNI